MHAVSDPDLDILGVGVRTKVKRERAAPLPEIVGSAGARARQAQPCENDWCGRSTSIGALHPDAAITIEELRESFTAFCSWFCARRFVALREIGAEPPLADSLAARQVPVRRTPVSPFRPTPAQMPSRVHLDSGIPLRPPADDLARYATPTTPTPEPTLAPCTAIPTRELAPGEIVSANGKVLSPEARARMGAAVRARHARQKEIKALVAQGYSTEQAERMLETSGGGFSDEPSPRGRGGH